MRILFITLTNIGDALLSTILLDRILTSHPEATVDIVCGERATDLFTAMPNLGRLVPLKKRKFHLHYLDLWRQLGSEPYDLVVDLRTPLLGRMMKGKQKLLYRPHHRLHKAAQYVNVWPLAEEQPPRMRVWVADEVAQQVASKALSRRPLVAFAPTANWIGKQWPQKNFAQLARALADLPELEGAHFAVFGAAHERPTVADFIASLPRERTVDLVGATSLPEAYCWLSHCRLFIGNDSGLAHMAAAADVPTVTLFGPTPDTLYAPVARFGRLVHPPARERVNLETTVPQRLITDITPEMVLAAARELLAETAHENGDGNPVSVEDRAAC